MLIRDIVKIIFRNFLRKTKSIKTKIQWKKKNKDNSTNMENLFDISLVDVGKGTYGGLRVINYCNHDVRLKIGSYCSIGGDVTFLLGGEHNIDTFSTYPFKAKIINQGVKEAGSKGDIIIEDDVWIGHGSIILSGVKIGQGAVIAAGSVVNKNIPAYAIVGGVPAKIIKYRFSKDIIDKLKSIDFSNLTYEKIIQNHDILYRKINQDNIDQILDKIK